MAEHIHGRFNHDHAHSEVPHSHIMRAVCLRDECAGFSTHNIHSGPLKEKG
jgi:hypothetical protein